MKRSAHVRRLFPIGIAASLIALGIQTSSCSTSDSATEGAGGAAPTVTPIPCRVSAIAKDWESFAPSDVAVVVEGAEPGLALVREDVGKLLGTMWGTSVSVVEAAPKDVRPLTIWASTSADAQAQAKLSNDAGYALRRIDSPSGATVIVAAHDAVRLSHGVYALMETLGARFFHPKQDFVPTFDGPRVPKTLDVSRTPAFADIGLQVHTLHPIEYFRALNEPGAENLADAKRLVDWLVRTGQNRLQWPLLSTVPFDDFAKQAKAIVDYAHVRGVRIGPDVQMYGGASLQNNYVLVSDAKQGPEQMDAPLEKLLPMGWDFIELALGEFIGANPTDVITWLNHAVDHLATAAPKLEVDVQNHVGNYPKLWVDYQGQKVFYYHLPQFADPRLGQSVHTLAFFDLYRDWATYAHPDFHLQHDYLLAELPSRRVHYFPESAYWISADIDVPLFLTEFIYARHNDIQKLTKEVREKGLPAPQAHITFSSGHEWGYWMTDYLVAKMAWNPEADLSTFFDHVSGAFGECQSDVSAALQGFTKAEDQYLFDERLMAYVQGENTTVDLGYLAGLETHPKRIAFEAVMAMDDGARGEFEAKVVEGLAKLAQAIEPVEATLEPRCLGADAAMKPWCSEMFDGVTLMRRRAAHASHLYRAILQKARGADPEPDFAEAARLRAEGLAVVARREAAYRFDVHRLVDPGPNPTIYPFGYLLPAHDLCYWVRQEDQVRSLLDNGSPQPIGSRRSCVH